VSTDGVLGPLHRKRKGKRQEKKGKEYMYIYVYMREREREKENAYELQERDGYAKRWQNERSRTVFIMLMPCNYS